MGITEDIFTRCQQILGDTAILLEGGKKITVEEIQRCRRAANIAGEASFILLQKAFITPFDREDIWDFRQACENVWEAAQDLSFAKIVFAQGAALCRELAVVTEQLVCTSSIPPSSLFSVENHFRTTSYSPLYQNFIHYGKQTIFCLQRILLKNS